MKLIAVRHTRLDIEPGICYGQSDLLPASTFSEEAQHVKEKLADKSFDEIFSSPLKRCKLLAEKCDRAIYIIDSRLTEIDFGDWELQPWENIKGEYAEKWFEDYINIPAPSGESLKDMILRVNNFVEWIKLQKFNSVLCFTHSGPIRVLHHLLKGLTLEELFQIEINYGGIYTFNLI